MAGGPTAFQNPFAGLYGKTAKDYGLREQDASKYNAVGNAAYDAAWAYQGKAHSTTERHTDKWGHTADAVVGHDKYRRKYESNYLGAAKGVDDKGNLMWQFQDFTNKKKYSMNMTQEQRDALTAEKMFYLGEEDALKWQTHTDKIDSLMKQMGYNPTKVTKKIKSPFGSGYMSFTTVENAIATDENFRSLLDTGKW